MPEAGNQKNDPNQAREKDQDISGRPLHKAHHGNIVEINQESRFHIHLNFVELAACGVVAAGDR